MPNSHLHISDEGFRLIQIMEGCKLKPYKCPANKWTVGFGHTQIAGVLAKAKIFLTQEQADKLLLYDLEDSENAVRRLVKVELTQGEFDALVSFTFNLGEGRLGSSTLLAKLNAGDKEGAAAEFTKWVMAGQAKLPGLVKRREAEQALFKGVA